MEVAGEECLYTLTAWNLPVVGVPHLYTSMGVTDGGIDLCIDFRPRAEAGYELRKDDGSYPEPETREMFMQASVRKEFADLYFDEAAEAWRATLIATAGAEAASAPFAAEAAGPLQVALRLPLSAEGVAAATAACADAAARWAGWILAAEDHDQRKTMMTLSHDTKLRTMCAAAIEASC